MRFQLLFLWIICYTTYGQCQSPLFLVGKWKVVDAEIYEHWDTINHQSMKGISYQLINNTVEVIEYLDINKRNEQFILSAHVRDNKGGLVITEFICENTDSGYRFSNPSHDFPQQINYLQVHKDSIQVILSSNNKAPIRYMMVRVNNQNENKLVNDFNPTFDKQLADKYGGDEYGMKMYYLVILKTGKNNNQNQKWLNERFSMHMEFINDNVKLGRIIVAGPLSKNNLNYRGIYILFAKDELEAKRIVMEDQCIKVGIFDFEIIQWYGSAALPAYIEDADKIWTKKP